MYQAVRRGRRIPREFQNRMPLGAEYLGEDESYWYYVDASASPQLGGMFNIGKMFKRMVKFTPSSFKLKNIAGALGSATAFLATGGIANAVAEIAGPSGLKLTKGTITGAHSQAMQITGYAVAAGAALVGGVMLGPSIIAMVGPKLAAAGALLGKAGGSIGGSLFSLLGKFVGGKQADVAQRITPEEIAYMERNGGAIPPSLMPYLDQAAAQSLPIMQAPNGAASLYDPSASYGTGEPAPVEAGFLDGLDSKTVMLIGIPAAFFLLQMLLEKKRR